MSTSFSASTQSSLLTSSSPSVDATTSAHFNGSTAADGFPRECAGLGATAWSLCLGVAFPVGLLGNCLVLYTYWRLRAKRQLRECLDTLLMAVAAADLASLLAYPWWVSRSLSSDAAEPGAPGCLAAAGLATAAHYAAAYLLLLAVCQSSFELLGPPHGSFARRLRARPLLAAMIVAAWSALLSVITMMIAGTGGDGADDDGTVAECLSCRPDPSRGRIGGHLFKFLLGWLAPAAAMSPFATRAFRELRADDSPSRHGGGECTEEQEEEAEEAARRRAERTKPYRAPFGITVAWVATGFLHGVSLLLRGAGRHPDAAGTIYSDLCLLATLVRGCASPLLSVTLRECYRESVLVFASWATGPCRGISTSQAHNKVMQPVVEVAKFTADNCSLHSTFDVLESAATPRMDGLRATNRREGGLSAQVQGAGENHSQPRTPRLTHRTLTV